jgi:hypothetical protein
VTDLLELISAGGKNVDRLSRPRELRAAAERVADVAAARGVSTLLAASAAAERVVGAALVERAGLRGLHSGDQPEHAPVLVVDVNLASGTALARAARRARQSGAERVVAVVFHQLAMNSPDARTCGVDELVILETYS